MEKRIINSVAFILKKENKILIEKRKNNKRTDPGLYCIPSGGINDGEGEVDAMRREVKEELGVDVVREKYLGTLIYETEQVDFKTNYYLISEWQGEINASEAELVEWRDIDENSVDIWPDKLMIQAIKYRQL